MRGGFASIVLVVTLLLASRAQAQTGVVLVHGKQGSPDVFVPLAAQLAGAGFSVESPEMCWSRRRIYDRPYLDCLSDIDQAVTRLRAGAVARIVVVGMSLGGNAALAYGARHQDLAGVIAVAPAHAPEFISRRPEIAESLRKARALLADGRGNSRAMFNDVNSRDDSFNFTVTTTAAIYLSFFAPDGAAIMPDNAERLTAPLLLISGTRDQTQGQGRARAIFARAPETALNRFVSVEASHFGTLAAGTSALLAWLQELSDR